MPPGSLVALEIAQVDCQGTKVLSQSVVIERQTSEKLHTKVITVRTLQTQFVKNLFLFSQGILVPQSTTNIVHLGKTKNDVIAIYRVKWKSM